MMRACRQLGCLVAFLILSAGAASAQPAPQGAWQEKGGTAVLHFDGDRILSQEVDGLLVRKILGREPGKLTVRERGLRKVWNVSLSEGVLRVERDGKAAEYAPLERVPAELELKPFPVAPARQLSAEQVKALQDEIAARMQRDQEVRKDPAKKDQGKAVDADNFAWLKKTLAEVGWLDRERFGPSVSGDAILMVKHSDNLALQMAVLSHAEKDFKADPQGSQVFAILYDAVQLKLGERQRYGTQLNQDAAGNPFVIPLEDAAKVDEIRKELGMPPLSEYLKLASQYLYEGKTIRIPGDDE